MSIHIHDCMITKRIRSPESQQKDAFSKSLNIAVLSQLRSGFNIFWIIATYPAWAILKRKGGPEKGFSIPFCIG